MRNYKVPLSPSRKLGHVEATGILELFKEDRYTMGKWVRAFERHFTNYVGKKYGIMVNSGSSALYATFLSLPHSRLNPSAGEEREVIVPAVGWSTDYSAPYLAGYNLVVVDVDPLTFNINPPVAEQAITDKTEAILAIHMLGNPAHIKWLKDIAERHNVVLIEDCCEAHGATWEGKPVGSFGQLSVYSFYYSHHMTSIEGGIILTDSQQDAGTLSMIRAHGWIRDLRDIDEGAYKLYKSHLGKGLDPRFLFVVPGLNFRPTEIQGLIGLHQLYKLDEIVKKRTDNAEYLMKRLKEELSDYFDGPTQFIEAKSSWLMFPIIKRPDSNIKMKRLQRFLERKGIETRPLMTGCITRQPLWNNLKARIFGDVRIAKELDERVFLIGCHEGLYFDDLEYIIQSLKEGVKECG